MPTPPAFTDPADYRRHAGDVAFWQPALETILARHEPFAPEAAAQARPGVGSTWPTFLIDGVVVKLFGHWSGWRTALAAERAALAALAATGEREAWRAATSPRLLAEGRLFDEPAAPWPYLVTSRVPGRSWDEAPPPPDLRPELAAALGRAVGRLHRLPTDGVVRADHWRPVPLVDALARSSLPPRLAAQAPAFLGRLGPPDPVFTHGDLTARHVFLEDGALAGVIDWGDAMVADRHYELAKLHLDLFDGDRRLLRAFLDEAEWPNSPDFAARALAGAVTRQAIGLAQHPGSMDVFHKVPAMVDLDAVETLDDLALALFAP